MALFLSVFPIVLLIYLMVKRNALPSYVALPLTALLIFVLQLTYFGNDTTLIFANIIAGLGDVLTPITVIFGRFYLTVSLKFQVQPTLCVNG